MIKDLTEGKPGKILWQFTMPMFVSVIFQQLYNIADSIIVGNFAGHGENALAAVGASYPITMIFIAIAMGCNVGCTVWHDGNMAVMAGGLDDWNDNVSGILCKGRLES